MLFTCWQCRNEDFSLAENNPKRNNSEFFKHASSGGLANRGGVDYVGILEAYNEENNFLATMSDQQGMPIWEKMMVFDTEIKTSLIIPLSIDNNTISSALFVNLAENSIVNDLRNIDNLALEKIINDQQYEQNIRESLLGSFLMLDQNTFGTKNFTNIPEDLFQDATKGQYNRLDITSIDHYVEHENTNNKIIVTQCLVTWNCKQNKSWEDCDKCSTCLKKQKCTHIILDDGSGYMPFPIYDLPPQGGGGGGTSGSVPPKDPCALNNVFYRMMPACGSTGTGDDGDFEISPVLKIDTTMSNTKLKCILEKISGDTNFGCTNLVSS